MKTNIIRVYGIVQGVGFRPFVSRICLENNIKGTVANKGSYVEIHAQGQNLLEKEARSTLDKQLYSIRVTTPRVILPNTANAHAPVRSELAAFVYHANFCLW